MIKIYFSVIFQTRNICVMAVGIGNEIDNAELKEIARGNAKHVVHVDNFDHLIANMDELLDVACQ